MNTYELKLYGVLYHKRAKSADSARRALLNGEAKRYKGKVKLSHIKLVRYYRDSRR